MIESIVGLKSVQFVADTTFDKFNIRRGCQHNQLKIQQEERSGCSPVPVLVCTCGRVWRPESASNHEAVMISKGFELKLTVTLV